MIIQLSEISKATYGTPRALFRRFEITYLKVPVDFADPLLKQGVGSSRPGLLIKMKLTRINKDFHMRTRLKSLSMQGAKKIPSHRKFFHISPFSVFVLFPAFPGTQFARRAANG